MRRMRLSSGLALLLLLMAGFLFPTRAVGATQLGDTFVSATTCTADLTYLQSASPSSSYSAPSNGVLTSWRFQASDAPPQLKLKVGRSAGGANFTIVGDSATQTPVANQLNIYPVRIPVQGGDVIGFYLATSGECVDTAPSGFTTSFANGDVPPGTTTNFSSVGGKLDIAATFEADADSDGFGDETQDPCPGGPQQQNVDGDGQADACDDDDDNDGLSDGEETRLGTNPRSADSDGDGVRDNTDNCATSANPDQADRDADGNGTACDSSEVLPGACTNVRNGTSRADNLVGTRFGDRLVGQGGNDRLQGRAGDDCLVGGSGRDRLSGGPGVNRYSAGAGNDTVNAANGNRETINCGSGRDSVRADRSDRLRLCERVRRRR